MNMRTPAEDISALARSAFAAADGNALPDGTRIFDEPLVGVCAADDALFSRYKEPDAIGPGFMVPAEWVGGARSVVSLFFPFSEAVRASNRAGAEPSDEWLRGKLLGQRFIFEVMGTIAESLDEAGFPSVVPSADVRFALAHVACERSGPGDFRIESAWSERHAAFAYGIGTFGLSRGLITERGMAGRFGSLVTTAPLEPTPRTYSEVDEWCTRCSACIRRCPPGAIDAGKGKNNALCEEWRFEMDARFGLEDACGKCQVRVPCEARRPREYKQMGGVKDQKRGEA